MWRLSRLIALSLVVSACSTAPEVVYRQAGEASFPDVTDRLLPHEAALPREPGPPVSRPGGPRYPDQALNFGVEGTVELVMIVGPDGRVQSTRLLSVVPQGYSFGIAAEEWVRTWTFAPSKAPQRIYFYRQLFKVR